MAAPVRASSTSDKKPSRQRHSGHVKTGFKSTRRRDTYAQRPSRWNKSTRRSPTRHFQPLVLRMPSPVSTPNTSTPALISVEQPRSLAMERTPSGNSIISDNTYEPLHHNTLRTCSDYEAASRVRSQIRRNPPDGQHERILRRLIDSREPIKRDDVKALDSALTAADVLFFDGSLKGRVRWDWSHPEEVRYQSELIGTTALRPAQQGGYETLIVLSDPILNSSRYDRRLLLSTFLHELIHCYLFILCGFDARSKGGHTAGFHLIAKIIDKWVGPGYLGLCNMKANLNHFRKKSKLRLKESTLEKLVNYASHNHEWCQQGLEPCGEEPKEIVIISRRNSVLFSE